VDPPAAQRPQPELLTALLDSPEKHARIAAATVKQHWGPADPAKGKMPNVIVQEEEKIKVTVPGHLAKTDVKAYKHGAEIFAREGHCITCHQEHGKGLDPIYPPIVGSPWVTGSEERLIKLTLHGLWGPIEVGGKLYDPAKGVPPMTAFGSLLNDEEVAAVLTLRPQLLGQPGPRRPTRHREKSPRRPPRTAPSSGNPRNSSRTTRWRSSPPWPHGGREAFAPALRAHAISALRFRGLRRNTCRQGMAGTLQLPDCRAWRLALSGSRASAADLPPWRLG
jgi:mono/diheme cytochrome c family protein